MGANLHHPNRRTAAMTQFKDKAAKLGFKIAENNEADDLKFEHQGARAQASINAVYMLPGTNGR